MQGDHSRIVKLQPCEKQLINAFQCLFQRSKDAIFILSTKGKVLAINRAAGRLAKTPSKHFLGKTYGDTIPPETCLHAKKIFSSVMKGKSCRLELQFSIHHKTATVEVTAMPCRFKGKTIALLGIIRDITKQKQIQTRLLESEQRFRSLVHTLPEAVYTISNDGKITSLNSTFTRLTGWPRKKWLGKSFKPLIHPEDLTLAINNFKKAKKSENQLPYELRIRSRSGKYFVGEFISRPQVENGEIVGEFGIVRNVTERKTLEERLAALSNYAKKINAAQNLGQIYKTTLDAIEKTLGFENAAFMTVTKGKLCVAGQRGLIERCPELPLDGSKRGLTVKSANTRKPVLLNDVQKNKYYVEGMPGVMSELAVPVATETEVLGVLDVESKRTHAFDQNDRMLLQILASHSATAMDNLKKREEIEERSNQLALLMEVSAEMIHSFDLHKRLQKIAEAIREHGWRRVVIRAVKEQNLEIADPKDLVTAGITKKERKFLWTNKMPGQVWRERLGPEYERFKVGEFYHLPWSDPWVRKRFSQGTVPSKLSQKEMVDWNPEDLLYAPLRLADGRIMGILSIDDPLDGKRPTEKSLAPLTLFIHQAAVAIENAYLIQQLNAAKDQIEEYANQLEIKVEKRTKELVEAQNRLVKTERLAAIGEVAAMVGHDLRNPLSGIAGATYYLKTKFDTNTNEKAKEMFELIEKDIEYSDKIITDLLDYSREMQLELKEATMADILKEALASAKVPSNINIVNLVGNQHRTKVDAEKLQRVFINIVRNGIDAMPNGGTLTIRSTIEEGYLAIHFTDTGVGLPKEALSKLWTPFFTTKAKGMGLGLPICKRIVEAHKGKISVESAVGKGTTFTIRIPTQPTIEKESEKIWVNLPEYLSSMMMKV